MRIAHLIVTYTNPLQTERMIRRMQHPDFDFYIHVDKKIDIKSHLYLAKLPQVYLIQDRTKVVWAGFNTVSATLTAVEEIMRSGRKYDYIHLMSGQDYPIKSADYIHSFFQQNNGREFLEFEHFDKWSDESYPRIRQYHLINYKFPGRYYLQWLMNRLLPTRKAPVKLEYYGSSMFWALTPACLEYVVKFMKTNPGFKRFMKFTWGSDEFLFQTLVLNSGFHRNVVNNNLLFLDRDKGASHPNILTFRHLDAILDSDKLFARKFDLATDSTIMDAIDQAIAPVTHHTGAKKAALMR
ncbi:MAG: glycosyl transferase [Gemmatimonadaceae bacterium]|nr:glycosyl transferase [Chitinophagaceae bacterium]